MTGSPDRAVVTGGTGFVGANLARRLLTEGFETHLLVRPGFSSWRIEDIMGDVRIHEVQLHDRARLADTIKSIRPKYAFHLAVFGAYPDQRDWEQMVTTNVTSTAAMLESCAANGCEAFVNTGSSSEYGFKSEAPAENAFLEPNSAYAVTKAAGTHFAQLFANSTPMRVATLRLYSAYGAFEEPSRLIPKLVTRGLEGAFPPLANPDIARDFVYIADVCDAYLAAARTVVDEKGAVYNVGSGTQTTLRDIVATVREILRIPAEPEWGSMQARAWDTNIWVSDSRKIARQLNWRASTSLERGLTEFADWFRSNPGMLERYRG